MTHDNERKLKDALNVAITLRREGRYIEALRHTESVEAFFDNSVNRGRLLNGRGATYFGICEYQKAVDSYLKALPFLADSPLEAAVVEGNIADSLLELDRLEEAHVYLDRSERVLKESVDKTWYAERRETRARCYFREGRFDEAKDAAKEAFDILCHGFDAGAREQARKTMNRCFEALEGACVSVSEQAGGVG